MMFLSSLRCAIQATNLSRGTKPDLEQAAPVQFIIGAVDKATENLNLHYRSDGSKRAVVELGALLDLATCTWPIVYLHRLTFDFGVRQLCVAQPSGFRDYERDGTRPELTVRLKLP
jgi:hypothetical protein